MCSEPLRSRDLVGDVEYSVMRHVVLPVTIMTGPCEPTAPGRSSPARRIAITACERSFGWLVPWGGLLRDRAGRLDVSAARLAFTAVLSGVEALINPMPIQAAAR